MRIDNRRDLHQACLNLVPHDTYCFLANLVNTVRGRRFRISPVHEEHVFLADDGESRIFFCRRRNGRRFRRGVMRRVDRLASAYHLDAIDVLPGGTFIDCGANIGELGLWARMHGLSYVAFEPETLEARCCDLNNFGGRPETERKALWKETATLSFHSRPETSDGSVFDMGDPISRVDVSAVTLDDAVDLSNGSGGTVIFKVEAEGAEPEVLEGASKTLSSVDWVAIDCGYERGREQAHTFVETNVFLHDCGFRPLRADLRRGTMLYMNTMRQ